MRIGNELKLLLAQNLFRFEDLEFSTEKIQDIFNEKVEALKSIELDDLVILNGIRRLLWDLLHLLWHSFSILCR